MPFLLFVGFSSFVFLLLGKLGLIVFWGFILAVSVYDWQIIMRKENTLEKLREHSESPYLSEKDKKRSRFWASHGFLLALVRTLRLMFL